MKKGIFGIAPTAVLIVMFGCATVSTTGEGKVNPDDLAAAAVDELVNAYEGGDAARFMTLVSARYLESYEDLQTALDDTLGTAVLVQLDIRPERIRQAEDGMVLVDAGWSKTIVRSTAPDTEITFGKVTLIFIRYTPDVLKLFSQKGDPVFP